MTIPDGEKIKAIRSLMARDVISGDDRYVFAAELQRLWIQKYEQAHGGDGQYRYYHDGLPVDGSRIEVIYRACQDKSGSFWVRDGSGRIVKLDYFFASPYCPFATPRP